MNNFNHASPSSLLFVQYGLKISESLPIVKEWLESNPQHSAITLAQLIKSKRVILKNQSLYDIPQLSLDEALILSKSILGKNGVEIKDRRYRFKKYPQCFIGSELVNWLIKNRGIVTEEAISMGQSLLEHHLISHILNEHEFKNDFLFYYFNLGLTHESF